MTKRAILVGAGGMGRAWARNLLNNPRSDVAAWVDVSEPALAQAVDEVGTTGIITTTSLEQALHEISADFVVDVTPPEVHMSVTLMSLAAGLPVLGEKPMASSMEEAQRMVEAAGKSGLLYMVSQSRRYNGNLIGYRDLIQRACGNPEILNADFYIGAHFGGFRDEMPSPLLLDMAIHTFDQARYLTEADPISVYCEEFNPSWSWYQGDACTYALFEMTGGLRFTYRGSWCAEGLPTSWEATWRAVGPRGTATWDGDRGLRGETVQSTGGFHSMMKPVESIPPEIPYGIESSLNDFLDALDTGGTPMGECHDNIKSFAMVCSALESVRTGRRVAVEY